MKKQNRLFLAAALAALVLAPRTVPNSMAASAAPQATAGSTLGDQVRKELNKLPFITVFDRMDYEVTGDIVRLTGQVTKPWHKSDAEKLVKRLAGVTTVVNEIEVLPLSRFDDQVRMATYRALFHSNSSLQHYRIGSNAPIRIIVRNGHISLEGFVGSQFDKTMAEALARHVPNAFSVTNNLKIG